jgi:hypothetical protein
MPPYHPPIAIVDESQHNRFATPSKVAYNDHCQGDNKEVGELCVKYSVTNKDTLRPLRWGNFFFGDRREFEQFGLKVDKSTTLARIEPTEKSVSAAENGPKYQKGNSCNS